MKKTKHTTDILNFLDEAHLNLIKILKSIEEDFDFETEFALYIKNDGKLGKKLDNVYDLLCELKDTYRKQLEVENRLRDIKIEQQKKELLAMEKRMEHNKAIWEEKERVTKDLLRQSESFFKDCSNNPYRSI